MMPALIRISAFIFTFVSTSAFAAGPALDARAWLLVDQHSGSVLVEHNADMLLAPASLTKLMTAYLVFEHLQAGRIDLQETVAVSAKARRTPGSRVVLRADSAPTVEQLIMSLIVRSANDATVALAEYIAGSEENFVAAMNKRAQFWGLNNTHFANASGLDEPGHRSTARDLSRIATALIRDFPEYYGWFKLKEFSFQGAKRFNSNTLLWRDETVDGVKTGSTGQAGYCLIASANRNEMRLIATVLGARSDYGRAKAAQQLIDYGFANFETRLLYSANSPATSVRVWMGEDTLLPVGPGQNLYVTLPRGWYDRLQTRFTISALPYAPVQYGQPVGTLSLQLEDRVFAEYPLIALKEIATGGLLQRATDSVQLMLR